MVPPAAPMLVGVPLSTQRRQESLVSRRAIARLRRRELGIADEC
jgi:hypothetical protein